jgi:hypothetical protein
MSSRAPAALLTPARQLLSSGSACAQAQSLQSAVIRIQRPQEEPTLSVTVQITVAACVAIAAVVFEVRRLRAFARDLNERWRHLFMGL